MEQILTVIDLICTKVFFRLRLSLTPLAAVIIAAKRMELQVPRKE